MDITEIKVVTDSLLSYICPDDWDIEKKKTCPIDAKEIVEAINNGKSIEIINAVIEGPFILKSVNVEGEINIQRTKIRDSLDWSYSTFKRVLNLKCSIFETDATFTAITVEKDIILDHVIFLGIATFPNIKVINTFRAKLTTFKMGARFYEGEFKKRIEFSKSTFESVVDFRGIRVGNMANFEDTVFVEEVNFSGAKIEGIAFFDLATFEGKADFTGIRVGLNANFDRVVFVKAAIFNSSQISWNASFSLATFKGEANFTGVQIGSVAQFNEAVFMKGTSFNGAHIGKAIFYLAAFGDESDFEHIRVGINANFNETTFIKKITFNGAHIEKAAFFSLSTFLNVADFTGVQIGSVAQFNEAVFVKAVSFNGTNIEGAAFFRSATFKGDADFTGARIGSNAEFIGAVFEKLAKFNIVNIEGAALFNPAFFNGEADFVGVRIGSAAEFTGAVFEKLAKFNLAKIEKKTTLEGAIFHDNVNFQDASFRTIHFGEPNVQFVKKIDLRGCTYNRIAPIDFWKQLVEHLDPYDRQPFAQLEDTFRRAGNDKLANKIYYMGMQQRSKKLIKMGKSPLTWMLDRLHCLFTGYGVRTRRLLWLIVPILLVGAYIFHLEGSVVLMPDIQPSPMIKPQESDWVAFWISLKTFLPVEIPSGADWKPSFHNIWEIQTQWGVLGLKFTTFATILTLVGWILVPVGVAGISGLLKRSK